MEKPKDATILVLWRDTEGNEHRDTMTREVANEYVRTLALGTGVKNDTIRVFQELSVMITLDVQVEGD